jgi:putative ABC transport system ATP-binding protein
MVTHDLELAKKCDRIIRLKNGQVNEDTHAEIETKNASNEIL